MSKAILIIGESGAGKTTSLRNLPPKETFYIDADKKVYRGKAGSNNILPTQTTYVQATQKQLKHTTSN